MGRGRGKGKKMAVIASHEDSGEEEKMPPVKRRGRPQKTLKDEVEEEEEETEKIDEEEEEEEDGENLKISVSNKDGKPPISSENSRKRKRNSQVKENHDSVKVENGIKNSPSDSIKSVGFRQNGSRRKNKPRRAAEVGVECK